MTYQFIGKVEILDSDSNPTIKLRGESGKVFLENTEHNETAIYLDPGNARLLLGCEGEDGTLLLFDSTYEKTIFAEGDNGGQIYLGCDENPHTIYLAGDPGDIALEAYEEKGGGNIILSPADFPATVHLETLGGGNIYVGGRKGEETIRLRGEYGNIYLGGNGQDGDLFVKNSRGKTTIRLDGDTGNIYLGGNGQDGDLVVKNSQGNTTIHLNGDTGEIRLPNADCAEEFDVAESEEIEPGTVMVLGQEDKLRPSAAAYDKRVGGVIAGAGDRNPGIILNNRPERNNRWPLALMGRVYCKVDAQYASIEVGDPLTTSPTAGHAMKATDPLKAFGAVLGKALRPLSSGHGLIPILVTLQ